MNKFVILIVLLFLSNANATTFNEIVKRLGDHQGIQEIYRKADSVSNLGGVKGSWGDPIFKIETKNFSKDSLKKDETPMTGIEFKISQKISLSTKYRNIGNSYKSLSKSVNYSAEKKKQLLIRNLWNVVITYRKLKSEINILNENLSWIIKILKVSKKLYANGEIFQQALLDIQVRKSEVEGELSNRGYELSETEDKLAYLYTQKTDKLNHKTIPWKIISKTKNALNEVKDFRGLALKEKIISKEFALTASKQNYIPDITFSLGYTKRSSADNRGDFIGAGISFPLPLSGKKYSQHERTVNEKYSAIKGFEDYKKSKRRDSQILSKEIKKIEAELSILKRKTIKFAKNSRFISSKSYGLGNTTYVELLQSELKLQKILLKKVMLEAKRDIKKINLKFTLGEKLYE